MEETENLKGSHFVMTSWRHYYKCRTLGVGGGESSPRPGLSGAVATVQGPGQAVGWGSLLPPLAGPKGKPGAGACVSQGSPENHTCDRAPLSEPAHVVLGAEKSYICCPRARGTGSLLVYGLRSHWCPPWRPRARRSDV